MLSKRLLGAGAEIHTRQRLIPTDRAPAATEDRRSLQHVGQTYQYVQTENTVMKEHLHSTAPIEIIENLAWFLDQASIRKYIFDNLAEEQEQVIFEKCGYKKKKYWKKLDELIWNFS